MIAKITKGSCFAGAVKYILNPDKSAEILDSDGVRINKIETIAHSFNLQAELNTRVSKPVGHISLDFSKNDAHRLTNKLMTDIAQSYMQKMGIKDTQYIIARHNDKEHPHLHIVFNRVNNNGVTISDRNDRFRSEKICKELTKSHNLYFAENKLNVKRHRLREPDKTKYEIYDAIQEILPTCKNWASFEQQLNSKGIAIEFKIRSGSDEAQGIRFSKNGYTFNGSKIDKSLSYNKLNSRLRKLNPTQSKQPKEIRKSHSANLPNIFGSQHFIPNPTNQQKEKDDDRDEEEIRKDYYNSLNI